MLLLLLDAAGPRRSCASSVASLVALTREKGHGSKAGPELLRPSGIWKRG
jgi:hypothetical protein